MYLRAYNIKTSDELCQNNLDNSDILTRYIYTWPLLITVLYQTEVCRRTTFWPYRCEGHSWRLGIFFFSMQELLVLVSLTRKTVRCTYGDVLRQKPCMVRLLTRIPIWWLCCVFVEHMTTYDVLVCLTVYIYTFNLRSHIQASSKLLVNYPDEQRSQILDYLFKVSALWPM